MSNALVSGSQIYLVTTHETSFGKYKVFLKPAVLIRKVVSDF